MRRFSSTMLSLLPSRRLVEISASESRRNCVRFSLQLMSAPEMFKVAEDENRMLTWLLRAVGVFVMFIGFALVLFPLSVIADFVPFIGSSVGAGALLVALVCTFVLAQALIAAAWLWYRPLVSVAVLVVGLGVAYGFRTLAARRTPARAQAALRPGHQQV